MLATGFRKLAASRVARGTVANSYGQGVQIASQLLVIPILSSAWGVVGIGMWMILFTIPQLLTVGDLGFAMAGGNKMTADVARDDIVSAARMFHALRLFTFAVGGCLVLAAGAVVALLPRSALHELDSFTEGHGLATILAVTAFGAFGLFNAVSLAACRAADAFASSSFLFQTLVLIESAGALGCAWLGQGPLVVAGAYAILRLTGTLILSFYLYHVAPWTRHKLPGIDLDPLREIYRESAAAVALPIAYAILLQGSVMAIGAAAGPAAVPAFAATRTLSRSILQFVFSFNVATMPRYTIAAAKKNWALCDRLVVSNLLIGLAALIPAAAALLMFGTPFIEWWSGGIIEVSSTLLALMVAVMLINGAWVPVSNLLLAVNLHASFSYFFLGVATAVVLAGLVLAHSIEAEGMAWAYLFGETVMFAWVWIMARKHLALNLGRLRRAVENWRRVRD